jgi:predicted CopG family antitoxin
MTNVFREGMTPEVYETLASLKEGERSTREIRDVLPERNARVGSFCSVERP